MAVSDYSTTAGSNTSISGINIAEGCSPGNLNNAIRQLMADVKGFYNGAQLLDADLTSWAGITRASGFDTFAATPSSANLRSLLTDETGTGAALFAGGDYGTPSALVLTNATGLPFAGLAGAAVITSGETIASNDNDTTVPTSAAVKDYADSVGRVPLASKTASASATLDFTEFNNAVYRRYEFEFDGVKPATDAVTLWARFSANGGVGYDAGATDYQFSGFVVAAGSAASSFGVAGAPRIEITFGSDVGNAASERGVTGDMSLSLAADAAQQTRALFNVSYDNPTTISVTAVGSGVRRLDQETDAIRFLFSSGNITSGTIRMYGIL